VPEKAEIIPFEPEQDNACEGSDKPHPYICVLISIGVISGFNNKKGDVLWNYRKQ
jgi:hypothetical protein